MSKFGIIFCGYNSEDTVEQAMSPFLDDDRFVIAAVSVPFAEYIEQEAFEDGTTDILREYHKASKIKYCIDSPRFIRECDARNLALEKLKREGVEFLWMVDADEWYSRQNLDDIESFVDADPESVWWRLSLKNYVFDDKTYLKEPFCPPRIFRVNPKGLFSPSFYWDNDIQYTRADGVNVSYSNLPNRTIPKETAWINHYTWHNNEIGKRKTKYQMDHFGGLCSFSWSEERGLHFSEEYYRLKGEPLPEVEYDLL